MTRFLSSITSESNEKEYVNLQAPGPERQENEERWLRRPPQPQDGACVICALAHRLSDVHQSHCSAYGLVNPEKRVDLFRLTNSNSDAQKSVITSVKEILMKHRVDHLCLWQRMFQNNNGSWKGFYSNSKGCERHKGTATRWSGYPAAHLRFHLLKTGVTNDSAQNLIRRSFTLQPQP